MPQAGAGERQEGRLGCLDSVPVVDGTFVPWLGEREFTNDLNPKFLRLPSSELSPPESINPKGKIESDFTFNWGPAVWLDI